MATRRRQQFVHGQTLWMGMALILLTALDALTLDLYFFLSLIGFLVLVELSAPFAVTPAWRERLKWIIFVGLILFAGIVFRRIIEIIPSGLI
jgi:hypothetical protein